MTLQTDRPGHDFRPRTVAIIQARLGSRRLPLKALLTLREKPVIDWVVERVARSEKVDHVIVAIPDTPLDDILAAHLGARNIDYIRGPENDVLKRFVQAADHTAAELVVRVCADNPLVWATAIDRLVDFYIQSGCDYAWNHIPRGNLWPDGLGAEIVSVPLLRELDTMAKSPEQREHCFNYIWENRNDFRMASFNPREKWLRRPDVKLDIDTVDDFRRLALLPLGPRMDAMEILASFPVPEEQA